MGGAGREIGRDCETAVIGRPEGISNLAKGPSSRGVVIWAGAATVVARRKVAMIERSFPKSTGLSDGSRKALEGGN